MTSTRTIQPFRLDKIATDPRFEELTPPALVDETLQPQGSLRYTASCEHTEPVSQCNTQAPGTHVGGKRDHQRLQQAMENEEHQRERLSHTELAYKRQQAADFIVQLAVKRGVKLRSGSAGRLPGGGKGGFSPPPGGGGWKAAFKQAEEEIPSLLLGQNPELSEIAEEISDEEEDGCSNMLWYDDILGPAHVSLLPTLDRHQMFQFVDQKRLKEGVIRFLKDRKERRKLRAMMAGPAVTINPRQRGTSRKAAGSAAAGRASRVSLKAAATAASLGSLMSGAIGGVKPSPGAAIVAFAKARSNVASAAGAPLCSELVSV